MLKILEEKLILAESWIAALSLLSLLALSVFQMLVRNLFDFGIPEIEILNRHLLLVCGAMGAILAASQCRHIKIDALSPLLSETTTQRLRCPLLIFTCIICAIFVYPAVQFCLDEWQYAPANERWILPFTLIYPIGFSLLSLHFFLLCFTAKNK